MYYNHYEPTGGTHYFLSGNRVEVLNYKRELRREQRKLNVAEGGNILPIRSKRYRRFLRVKSKV